jgi:hypothetical protein
MRSAKLKSIISFNLASLQLIAQQDLYCTTVHPKQPPLCQFTHHKMSKTRVRFIASLCLRRTTNISPWRQSANRSLCGNAEHGQDLHNMFRICFLITFSMLHKRFLALSWATRMFFYFLWNSSRYGVIYQNRHMYCSQPQHMLLLLSLYATYFMLHINRHTIGMYNTSNNAFRYFKSLLFYFCF